MHATNYRYNLTFIARWSLRADECNAQHPQYTHPHTAAGRHDLSKVVLFLRGKPNTPVLYIQGIAKKWEGRTEGV